MRSKMESILNPLATLEKKTNKLPTTEEPIMKLMNVSAGCF